MVAKFQQHLSRVSRSKPWRFQPFLKLLRLDEPSSIKILRTRYYRFTPDERRLCSVASDGHNAKDQEFLEAGGIVKFCATDIEKSSDTFWCMKEQQPIVFHINQKAKAPYQVLSHPNGFTFMEVRDECRSELGKRISQIRLDLPLFVSDSFSGKISCDIQTQSVEHIHSKDIETLAECARLMGPYLELIYTRQVESQQQSDRTVRLIKDIETAQTVKKVYDLCVNGLSKLFSCKYASIFTMVTDSLNWSRLVLRKTSFERARQNIQAKSRPLVIDLSSYDLGQDLNGTDCYKHLTGWVAAQGRSLCIHDLKSRNLRERLRAYDAKLQWKNKFQDSERHSSFLAVPIFDASERRVLGVLRFTEKTNGERKFTPQDLEFIEWFAREIIGPKLSTMPSERFAEDILSGLGSFQKVAILESTDHRDFADGVLLNLANLFAKISRPDDDSRMNVVRKQEDGDGENKFFLFNQVVPQGARFRHRAAYVPKASQGVFELPDSSKLYALHESLTERAIKHNKPILLINLRFAESQGAIRRITQKAVCALAAPIAVGPHSYGAIAVYSDRFDLSLEYHGQILTMVCDLAAQIIARRHVRPFSLALNAVRHDCLNILGRSEALLEDVNEYRRFVYTLLQAFVRHYPVEPSYFCSQECRPVVLRSALLLAKAAASFEVSSPGEVRISCDPRLTVDCYEPTVLAIVYNLMKNARTYTRRGADIDVSADVKENGYLCIDVKDRGIGMSDSVKRDVKRILNPDELLNVDLLLSHGIKSSESLDERGRGLLICSLLASQYRFPDGRSGRLQLVRTKKGVGSHFVLELPVPPS